jgi:hypothetical protein
VLSSPQALSQTDNYNDFFWLLGAAAGRGRLFWLFACPQGFSNLPTLASFGEGKKMC